MNNIPHTFSFFSLASFTVLLMPTGMLAQSYSPFNANAVAVYTTSPEAGPTSSLAITETEVLDGDSVFHPVKTFNSESSQGMLEVDWENCEESFWSTGDMCYPANIPLWLGAEIRKTASETYEYTTGSGEVLTFDFGIAGGDSALIYQNTEMQLYLIAEGESTGNFLGIEETTFQYYLAHLDSEGEPLGTDLHEAPITLSDQLGAIHFMRIDSFPQILQPITIVGHSGAEAGLYRVKMAEIYDFQIGDVFQYFYHLAVPYPGISESYYETHTVTERIETEIQINYTFNVHRFTLDSIVNETFEASQTTYKSAVWSSFPFELQEIYGPGSSYMPNGYIFQNLILTADSCVSSFTYSTRESFYHSCPVESTACYGHTLHVSPEDYYFSPSQRVYKQGHGITYSYDGKSSVGSGGDYSDTRELIYSSKDGIDCGNQIALSTENQFASKKILRVFPNPAKTTVRLDLAGVVLTNASLHDMQGRKVLDATLLHKEPALDVSTLPKGMYIIRAISRNGNVYTKKLVVE